MSLLLYRCRFFGLLGLFLSLTSLSVQAIDDLPYKSIPVESKYQANLTGEGKRVLGGCISSIRKASPESYLDAYADEESVKYLGTEEERFQLEKCMAQYGFPITTMHIPGRPN